MATRILRDGVRRYRFVNGLRRGVYLVEKEELKMLSIGKIETPAIAFKINDVILNGDGMMMGYEVEETRDAGTLKEIANKYGT